VNYWIELQSPSQENHAKYIQKDGTEPGHQTYGSGECIGEEKCLIYCVLWKTRNARLARKSRADSSPAAGLSWKPVLSANGSKTEFRCF